MPKNAHPPRGKPAKKAPPPEEDTSFIVFGDGKPKKKRGEGSAQTDDKSKVKGTAGQAEDAPKKPDTRTLIAGASWTGKLPVNLFSEHLQKQHWDRPDYRIVRIYIHYLTLETDICSAKMATSTLHTLWFCRRRTRRRKKSQRCLPSRSPPSLKNPHTSPPPSKRATSLPHTLSSASRVRRTCI